MKKNRKSFYSLFPKGITWGVSVMLMLLLCVPAAFAQNTKAITGSVADSKGEAIIGANVIIKNTNIGTITDINGNFTLHAEQGTGLFPAFKKNGDVMAVFVGHDHLNDYVVCWKEIMLCYGRVSGSRKTSHYNHPDGSNGARVIELTEGERAFESWIRLRTGEKIKSFQYPFDFIDK